MRTADVLHFACHACVRAEATELSYLEFGEDRRLRVVDILARGRTSAPLVFLSACSTTLGRVTPSDEVASLSRAFLYAGAHAVIATLWPIDDKAAAPFVIDFFNGWRSEQLSLRHALARARRLHRARPWVSDAFQLIEAPGDGDRLA
jgi:CHAT domain-containing protein